MKPLDLVGTLTFTFFLLGVSRSKNSCPELDPNNNTVTKPFQVDQCKKFLTSAARTANISFFMETLLKLEKLLIWLPETSEYNNLVKNTTKATFNLSDFQINSTVTVSLDEYPDPDQKLIFLPFTAQELLEPLDVLFGLVFGVTLVNYKKKVVNADAKIMLSTEECPAALLQPAKMPDCRFYNYTTGRFERSGCRTDWKRDRCQVECSCNHTTFFALLMVPSNISEVDLTALTYISLVGCSVSIVFLPLSLVIYVCNRRTMADTSIQVHVNLAAALILLNVHFIPNQWVAELSSPGTCVYLAVMLHYAFLATLTWMFLEGLHVYMLLVRVFNIHFRRYLLKLCMVGWGVPAVVVAIIVTVKRDVYQRVTLRPAGDATNFPMCYVSDDTVRIVSNMVPFGLVFLFNVAMLIVATKHISSVNLNRRTRDKSGVRKLACNVLATTCLLGATWGFFFFSFGPLPTPGLYLFCIVNSLQGVFLFFWFYGLKMKATKSSSFSTSLNTSLQRS